MIGQTTSEDMPIGYDFPEPQFRRVTVGLPERSYSFGMTTDASYFYTDALDDLSHTSSLDDTSELFKEIDPMITMQEDSPSVTEIDEVLQSQKEMDVGEQVNNAEVETEPSPKVQ